MPSLVEILQDAQAAVHMAQTLGLANLDPRIGLVLALVDGSLNLVTPLLSHGVVNPQAAIEVDQVGQALLASIQRQLDELGERASE